jgi:hypothetical protein
LWLSLMIAGWLSLQSSAEDGSVYPDTAGISFTRQVISDTVTITILSLSEDSLTNLFISDFTASEVVFIECRIDGNPVDSLPTEREFGSVYPHKYTTRWTTGDFYRILCLKYYSSSYNGYYLSWCAGHPYPVLGMISAIGPPGAAIWQQ